MTLGSVARPAPYRTLLHGPNRLWSLRAMFDLELRYFDLVMSIVRRKERTYDSYSIAPPGSPGQGLFGLSAGLINSPNALSPKPPPSPYASEELLTDQRETAEIVKHLAGLLEMEGVL